MKKKPILMIASTLIALLLLTPIAHAGVVRYLWDNVYFKYGTDIDYAHPDNDYYGISPSIDWTRLGDDLHHHQINRDTTTAIVIGTVLIVEVLQLIISIKLGGGAQAQVVGGLAGIALATFIGMVLDYYFVDERGCMWLWVGSVFMAYLLENLPYLFGLYPEIALATILAAFVCYGYLRLGQVTFHDPLGIGNPSPNTLTIESSSHGTTNPEPDTYTYPPTSSVSVTADPDDNYVFDYWILDGVEKYSNPISVEMDSDHTLKAYFEYSGGGGGGGGGWVWVP